MPTKEKITPEIVLTCKCMLEYLLVNTQFLGAGYVLQLVYELGLVVISDMWGC